MLALVSVQPSSAEELPETAIKALEETLLDGVMNKSAIVFFVFPFCSCDRLTGSKKCITILW